MAERIPQSVAIRVPLQGYLAADHFSPATGLTIAITISKNGGAYGNPSAGATNATGIANGSYYVDLSTTDTGTVGPLFVRGTSATMDPITAIYNVVTFVDQTGDAYARQGAPAGASISADIAAVKTDTAAVKVQTDKLTFTVANVLDANTLRVGGTVQTARDLGASVLLSTGTGTGQLDFTSGVVKANATQWLGGTIPAVNVTGVPLVDLKYTLGTISPATAGSVRADSVTGAVGSVTGAVGSVTGAVGSVTGSVGSVTGAVGSVTGNVGGNVVGSVASVTAVVSANVTKVNSVTVNGVGTAGSPWGP